MRVGQTRIHLEKSSPPKKNHSIGGSLQIPLAKGKVKGKDQVIRLDQVGSGSSRLGVKVSGWRLHYPPPIQFISIVWTR